jgi:hypothetical protein
MYPLTVGNLRISLPFKKLQTVTLKRLSEWRVDTALLPKKMPGIE